MAKPKLTDLPPIEAATPAPTTPPAPAVAPTTEAPAPVRAAKPKLTDLPAEPPRLPSTHLPAFANPYEALGAVEKARQQREDRLIEEGADPIEARRVSTQDAARLLVYPAERQGALVDAVVATGTKPPSIATTATRVLGPGVRGITPGESKTRAERDEEYKSLVAQYDASWGNLDAAADMFRKVWSPDPTKMAAQSEQDKTTRGWMDNLTEFLTETAGDYYKNLLVVPAALERAHTAVTTGDPFAREKARAKLGMEVAEGAVTDPDVQAVASPSGVVGLAQRAGARLEAAVPGAAYLEAAAQALSNGGHISPTDVQTIRQKIRDGVPDDVFDNEIAPVVRSAATSKNPAEWLAAQEAILAAAPIVIPDASQYNAPDVRKFRQAYEANPSAFTGEAWADFRRRMEQKADDGEVQTALRLVPFGQLMTVQDNVAPTVDMLAALAERRETARKETGGIQTDAFLRLLGTAATKPVVVDGQIASVESRAAWAMRLAGAAFQTLAEVDVPLGDLPPVRVVAAIADKAGASELADQFRATRIPTPRGVDRMLATGKWDDALRTVGLGPYRPLLGDDGSTMAARVLADLTLPEYQGFQWGNQAIRAGADPTGTLVSGLDVLDLVGQFLVPAEGIVGAIPGAATRGLARAVVGAGEMPKGYKLAGALAKAAPATYSIVADVPLRDLDGDTALQHALRSSVLDMVKAGRDPLEELPPGVMDNVKNGLRTLGVDPDVALADLSKHAQWRRARIVDTTQNLLAMSATPEQEALRATPAHAARAKEYEALVQAGTLTPEQAKVGLRLDEVRAFLLTDVGEVPSPEDYFARIERQVGGTSGAGAYFQGENTPEFKAWFGNSKVVDDKGAPLVVYHGTPEGDFTAFRPSDEGVFFTTSPETANTYIYHRGPWLSEGRAPSVIPAYVSLRNPLVIDANGKRWDNIPVPWQAWKPTVYGNLPKNAVKVRDVVAYAKVHGHDGVILKNLRDAATVDTRVKPADVVVAFDPAQVKSVHNRGTFDPNDPNILHSTIGGKQTEQGTIERVQRPVAPTFYSGLRRAVEGIKQERFTAEQLRGILAKTPSVKADEIEWTRLDDFLREHPKPTKAEVLGWLDENAVDVRVVRRSAGGSERAYAAWADDVRRKEAQLESAIQDEDTYNTPRIRAELAALNANEPPKPTKWGLQDYEHEQLEMPGGEDYREVLLTLPKGEGYESNHWEEPNVVAHFRANVRKAANGKRYLHLEEVQSDWHQEGNKAGYASAASVATAQPAIIDALDTVRARMKAIRDEAAATLPLHHRMDQGAVASAVERLPDDLREEYADLSRRDQELSKSLEQAYHAVPPAPFTDTWTDLAVKQALRMAAEEDLDGVTWTTSAQQRARYPFDKTGKPRDIPNGPEFRQTYDNAIPQFLNKQGKRFGAKVGRVDVPVGVPDAMSTLSDLADRLERRGFEDVGASLSAAQEAIENGASFKDAMRDVRLNDGDFAAAVREETEKLIASPGQQPMAVTVHAFDIPPKMRDALLHEGQPLFQRTPTGIHGSIEPKTIGYLQRFFQTADFNTLLHEDGHLLRFLFGDRWTSDLARHFDHTIDPNGFTVLTRKGEEQAAEALRYWFRTRLAPNGRLRAYMEQADLALRNLWLGLRNEPELLPAELRTMFDATLRPDDAVRPSAVTLVDEELPRPRVRVTTPPSTPEGNVAAVVDNPVLRKGRAMAASRVRTDPEAVRLALGLNADAFGADMPVDEVVAGLVAHSGVEHARRRWTGEDLKVITERSVVPASRVPRVRADVTKDLRQTLGVEVRSIVQADGSVRFDDAQAASVYGLITRLADSPSWRGLDAEALAFNPKAGDRSLSNAAWASVQETLTDHHAGVGRTRDAVAEASQASVLTAFSRGIRNSLVALDPAGDRHIRDVVEGYERLFIVDAGRGTYGTPEMHAAQDKALRSLGEVPTEIKAMVRAARANDKAGVQSLGELLRNTLPCVSPDIPTPVAPELLEWHRKLSGQGDTAREVARNRARQEAELAAAGGTYTPGAMASADELDLATLTDQGTLDTLTNLLSASPGGMTDKEVAAIDWLRKLGATPSPGKIDALTPYITDAVSIVQTGVARRWEAVKDAAAQIIRCGAGSDDTDVLARLGVDEGGQVAADNAYVLAYQHFHDGDFVGTDTGLFRLLAERGGLKVTGPEYNQGAALLAMFTRMRSRQILRDYAAEITAMGLGLNVDELAVRGTTLDARNPRRYAIGSRPEGADNFAQRVLDQINTVVSWHAMETQEQRAGGGLRAPRPAEGAAAPIGLENMEAATTAMRILDQAGWPIGKGVFNQTPLVFSDGSTLLIPEMFKKEIDATLEKTAKVGTAYVDAGSGEVARKLGLVRDETTGRATGTTAGEKAEIAQIKKARAAGAAVGGAIGALASGPIGAGAGALIGGSLGPEVMAHATTGAEDAARFARTTLGGGEAAARVVGGAAGAALGATRAAVRAPLELALKTWTSTTRLARLGMTTGLALPNVSSFIGNLWGAFFQAGQGLGWGGATRAWFSEPRFVGDVVAQLWGDGPTTYRIGSKPIVTDDGRILVAQHVVDDFVHRGMDSSYPKAESSNALYADAEAQVGRWLDRFLKTPGAAVLEPLSGLQDTINEAWTAIDNMNRVAVYVEAVKRGSSRGEAADLARLTAFDYGHLTDFERERMRHIVLFYGFMRQNIRLWWWTMLNHPDRVLGQLRMAGGLQRAWVEEEPDITVPDYLDGRFMLWFRKASLDAYGQGVATIAPPIPAADVINLFSEMAGMAAMEQPSWQDAIGRLDPKLQVPIALATDLDPRTNRDLLDQAKVPNWIVEGDRLLSGGQLADVVLQVENVTNRDPTRDSYDDSGYYRARNKANWLVLRTVLQIPPFGRSMDTLEKIDRAAPFGEPGPISSTVNALRWYREAGGNPELDAFFTNVAPVLLKPMALMTDSVAPPTMPPLANPPTDIAPVRPGMTAGEERGGVVGFTPVLIGTPEEVQGRMLESIRREAEHEGKDTAKGATYPRR